MSKEEHLTKRREFLKKSFKGSVMVAGATVLATGCAGDKLTHLSNKKSKKEEILYQKSPAWDIYYSVAK